MINVRSKRCVCGKRPHFNLPGEITGEYCAVCKTEGMIDVISKRCVCGKSTNPVFNLPDESPAKYCATCKTEGMINIKHKRCVCGKTQPHFNLPGESTGEYCATCKTEGMINVISKRCVCGKSTHPIFSLPGKITAEHCTVCKTEGMIDVIHKRCNGCFDNDGTLIECPYKQWGNPKYRFYCTECFRHNFPKDPLTFQIRRKIKEIAVRDYINQHFQGFLHDKRLETGHCDCTIKRKPDHYIYINNTVLCIETDENQHKSYNQMDEETRYDDLYMGFAGKWVYIRFNPDAYRDQYQNHLNPTLTTRFEALHQEIDRQMCRIHRGENKELVERVYMYYDDVPTAEPHCFSLQ
jgi:hypothetical protein